MNSSGKGGVMTFEILHRYLTVFLKDLSIPHSRAESLLCRCLSPKLPQSSTPRPFSCFMPERSNSSKGRATACQRVGLNCSEQKMPQDIYASMDQGRCEDGSRLAPRPAIEEAGDGSEQHIAPVGKAHVSDVGETKKKGSGPPAREVALRRA